MPPDRKMWDPLDDNSMSRHERFRAFHRWVSGYFSHGNTLATLADGEPLAHPPPSYSTLTPEQFCHMTDMSLCVPDKADSVCAQCGLRDGYFKALRDGALYPRGMNNDQQSSGWDGIELRHILCGSAHWEMTWARWKLEQEIKESQKSGRVTRPLKFLNWEGANGFVSFWFSFRFILQSYDSRVGPLGDARALVGDHCR